MSSVGAIDDAGTDIAEALLSVRGLVRRPWIENFSLELRTGEIVALRAPSGSGKSLLLRALADLDPSDAGELCVSGRVRDEVSGPEWRRLVHYVAPGGVGGEGRVSDWLASARGWAGVQASALWDEVPGVKSSANLERLSSGEAQRLALHAALCAEPEVLLLDEATSALDAETTLAWEARVQAFARAGGAVLWATHDDGLVERVAVRSVGLTGESA